MNSVRAFWCELVKPVKIIFWVIIGIVVIGIIWVVSGVLMEVLS